jgi:aspartate aminotransferase
MSPAAGGFYLFPRFEAHRDRLTGRGIDNGRTFCERLLEETGVAALPGDCFGRPDRELSLRLAIGDFDGETALARAADAPVDEAFVKQHCDRVTTAIDSLADWVGR